MPAKRRIDQPRIDDVGANAALGALLQPAERRFRRVIRDQLRTGTKGCDRRDKHDRRSVGDVLERLAAAEHRTGQVDRERIVPLLEVNPVEAERADPDADIEHHAVEAAETIHRLIDHPVHIVFARDVGFDRKGLASIGRNALDGVIGAGAVQIGDRDMGPFPRKQQRHRPAVSDGISGGVERPLPPADDQNLAALKPPAARCLACGFRA
jgi:hypothetical protein